MKIEILSLASAKPDDQQSATFSQLSAEFPQILERQWGQIPTVVTPIYSKVSKGVENTNLLILVEF